MAFPRRIYKGITVKSTRVIRDRKYLLKPSDEIVELIRYCIGLGVMMTGVRVHALCWLMNHYHGVFTDPRALFPEFQWWLHRMIAVGLNKLYDKSGANWENGSYNLVDLVAPIDGSLVDAKDCDSATVQADVLHHMDYVELNAMRAGLVHRIHDWIGVRTTPASLGRTYRVEKPRVFAMFFWLPAEVEFTITKPPQFSEVSDEDFFAMRRARIALAEARHREAHPQAIGVAHAMRVRPFDSPQTPPPQSEIEPTVCGLNGKLLAARTKALRRFRVRYRVELNAKRRHDARVSFPAGSYWQRRFFREETDDNPRSTDPLPVPSAEQDRRWEQSLN